MGKIIKATQYFHRSFGGEVRGWDQKHNFPVNKLGLLDVKNEQVKHVINSGLRNQFEFYHVYSAKAIFPRTHNRSSFLPTLNVLSRTLALPHFQDIHFPMSVCILFDLSSYAHDINKMILLIMFDGLSKFGGCTRPLTTISQKKVGRSK